jgi:hypothetical protein
VFEVNSEGEKSAYKALPVSFTITLHPQIPHKTFKSHIHNINTMSSSSATRIESNETTSPHYSLPPPYSDSLLLVESGN